MAIDRARRRAGRQQGFTLVEMSVAAFISSLVIFGLYGMLTICNRIIKTTMSQQIEIKDAKKAVETIDREIRLATLPVTVRAALGSDPASASGWGNYIEFGRPIAFNTPPEPSNRRSIRLDPGPDGNFLTPWDNTLIYDPNTGVAGDQQILARYVSPLHTSGAFFYQSAPNPVVVSVRVGDPRIRNDTIDPANNPALLTPDIIANSDARTGQNLQGVEIDVSVSPRNI